LKVFSRGIAPAKGVTRPAKPFSAQALAQTTSDGLDKN
jgi:hypothetical protein